jgi:sigma-B regulation protein RsbU (phosphoserine phosphatase)
MEERDQKAVSSPLAEERWHTLIHTFRLVSISLDLSEILRGILHAVKQLIPYDAAGVFIFDPATGLLHGYETVGYPESFAQAGPLHCCEGIVGHVLHTSRGRVVPDVTVDPHYIRARAETRSELAAPLIGSGGKTIGVINLESDRPNAYSEADLELLTLFASVVAIAIEKAHLHQEMLEKRRLESELRIARQVMEALMPSRAPAVAHFEIFGRMIPSAEVGGDYYDFIDVADGRLGVVIADVSGKGVPAALIMATFRASLHALLGNDFALRAVFSRLNRLLLEITRDRHFVTAFYGELDAEGRRMFYLNAGHNPPLLIRDGEPVKLLSTGGIPLGILKTATFSEDIVYFLPGDSLILYTDGITEAENAEGEPYGVHRLEQVVRRNLRRSAAELCEAIIEDVRQHAEADARSDDLTVVVVRAV